MATEKTKKSKENKDPALAKKERMINRLKTVGYLSIIFGVIAALILFAVFVLDPLTIYRNAGKAVKAEEYTRALEMYNGLDGFLQSEKKIAEIQGILLELAVETGDYEDAVIAAESSGKLQEYIEQRPEIFYHYGVSVVEKSPTVAIIYLGYVLDYPGAREVYDEACLRASLFAMESRRYSDAINYFDEASSLEWFKTLEPAQANEYAVEIGECSYLRSQKVLSLLAADNPAAADLLSQIKPYMQYCGTKTCVSDTAEQSAVDFENTFDFLVYDDSEYLIVFNGDVSEVIDYTNYIFVKDTDGTYFSRITDTQTSVDYAYRFSLLDDGTIMEKTTITFPDGEVEESSRLWS